MIKKITYTFFFLISISLYSQVEKLNNYKYIIIPDKFDFVKSTDQYSTSSLTKFLLKKKGFKVFLSNETLPEELAANRCLSLEVIVLDKPGMFTTKNYIEFKDCYNKIIFTTKVGKSEQKEYRKAYQEGIRNAYNTMSDFEYSYTPLVKKAIVKVEKTKEVIPNITTVSNVETTSVVKNEDVISIDILYAQSNNNGFQLVNKKKPEVAFIVLKTNIKDVFIIKDKNGVLYKKGNNWIAEYYENNLGVKKEYQIKF